MMVYFIGGDFYFEFMIFSQVLNRGVQDLLGKLHHHHFRGVSGVNM